MCDLRAFLNVEGKESLILEAVNHVSAEAGAVTVRNLFGEEKKINGAIREVSLVKNRLVIEGSE